MQVNMFSLKMLKFAINFERYGGGEGGGGAIVG